MCSPVLLRNAQELFALGLSMLLSLWGGNLVEEGFVRDQKGGLLYELDHNHPEGRVSPKRFRGRAWRRDTGLLDS